MINRVYSKNIEKTIPVRPVRKKSVPEEIIKEIRSLIDEGYLVPGSKLPGERELAQMMNVSRPSLREALKVLSLLGVIVNRPGSGTFLSSASDQWPIEPFSILFLLKKSTLFEIFDARKILEGGVAALASNRRTDEDLKAMEEKLEKMRLNIGSQEKYAKYELEFHRTIIETAGNRVIADLMEKLYQLLKETRARIYQKYSFKIRAYREEDFKNHMIIYNAIKGGDALRASKAMAAHLVNFEKRLRDEQKKIGFS
jgi:GntR family transcriptional regulator, transcriptional repressor for pyruvate dehydrogenase complex